MAELKIEIPELLKEDSVKLEREVEELIALEKKNKLISLFIDEVMNGAKQLTKSELVELGRDIKKGRVEKLKKLGLV